MNMIPCTVGILTKNSGLSLRRTLESVKDFLEIIICDGGSTDDTIAIAREYGARIVPQNKEFLDTDGYIQDFSAVRNQTLAAATFDWYSISILMNMPRKNLSIRYEPLSRTALREHSTYFVVTHTKVRRSRARQRIRIARSVFSQSFQSVNSAR